MNRLLRNLEFEAPPREKPAVVSDVRERQGVTGHNVRYVLLLGTLSAVIALAAVLVVSLLLTTRRPADAS